MYAPPIFLLWGLKSQKIIFDKYSRHFRQFRRTLIFFIFDKIFLYAPKFIFLGGGGLKSPKLIFDQFSYHFRQFSTTLILFIFDKTIFRYPIFLFFYNQFSRHFNLDILFDTNHYLTAVLDLAANICQCPRPRQNSPWQGLKPFKPCDLWSLSRYRSP